MGPYPIVPEGLTSTNYAITYSNGTLTVTSYALSLTAHDQSRAYGAANPTLTGSLIGLQSGDNIEATYATAADTNSAVGGYPITISLSDPDGKLANYAVTTNNGTLTVNPAALAVTGDPQAKWYGEADPALTYRLTSGALLNGDRMTGALTRAAGENAGTYAILQGTLSAGTNYALTYAGTNLTIWPNWLTVTAEDQSRTYGATNPVLQISYGGFVGAEGPTNLMELPQVGTTAQPDSPAGDYAITLTGGSAVNYRLILNDGTLTVTPAPLTVTANDRSRMFGAPNPDFTGTVTGVQNGDNITATYATAATNTSPVGTYPIVPTLSDPGSKLANYSVTLNNGTLTVTAPATPAISSIQPAGSTGMVIRWSSISNRVYRVQCTANPASTNWLNLAPDVTATGSSASFTDNANGTPQRFYRVVLLSDVTPLLPLVVVVNNASRVYGAANPAFGGTITGLQGGDNISATYAAAANLKTFVGSYPILPTLSDPEGKLAKYSVAITNGTLSVTAATLTVVADNASRALGAANPVLSGTVTGVQNDDGLSIQATYATTATIASPVGPYPITPSLADPLGRLVNYTVTVTNGTLTVAAPVIPTISSIKPAGNTGMVITWRSASNSVYRVQCKASPASTNWINLAPDVTATGSSGSFTDRVNDTPQRYYRVVLLSNVSPLIPMVVVVHNASRVYGAANPAFTGTITGLQGGDNITATYTSAAIPNSSVGGYPILPSLIDPDGKLAKYSVTITNGSLTITAAALTVVGDNASHAYGATNPVLSGTVTGMQNDDGLTIKATYATTATPASRVGAYPITPTLTDPQGRLVNYTVTVTNGTLTVTSAVLTVTAYNASRVYGAPNPAFTGTVTGLQNGDPIVATYASAATNTSPAGTYLIVPTLTDPGSKLINYSVTLNNGTLTVTAPVTPVILSIVRSTNADMVIAWNAVSNRTYHLQVQDQSDQRLG